eukprot:49253-Eustigmatos_ZCMA.PRE.1
MKRSTFTAPLRHTTSHQARQEDMVASATGSERAYGRSEGSDQSTALRHHASPIQLTHASLIERLTRNVGATTHTSLKPGEAQTQMCSPDTRGKTHRLHAP